MSHRRSFKVGEDDICLTEEVSRLLKMIAVSQKTNPCANAP
jgi:hypothetical protein